MMKKAVKFFFTLFIFFIFFTDIVSASEISVEDVTTFMKDNNILDTQEYFKIFGKILNGNDNEYDIDSFKYDITSTEDKINIKVTLNDKKTQKIEKDIVLNVQDNKISYTNANAPESLDSRIATIILNELIYSIGGARNYDKNILVDWMNQININGTLEEDGITTSTKKVKYEVKDGETTYEYESYVPLTYTIDINKITDELPPSNEVEITNIEADVTSVTIQVYSGAYNDKNCSIYRLNDNNEYELVGNVSCQNGKLVDNNLKENTTYYYTASVENRIMCSKATEVTTKQAPNTGKFLNTGIIVLILIIAAYSLYIANKKSRFL